MEIINGEIKKYCCKYIFGYINHINFIDKSTPDNKNIIRVDKGFKKLVYDGDLFFTISYCPFCGEKVEYIEKKAKNKC